MIVCSKEGEDKSHIVSKLLLLKRSIILKHGDKCQSYLRGHFIQAGGSTQAINTSIVDLEKWVNFKLVAVLSLYIVNNNIHRSCVRVVSSKRTGMGKSLFIQRMANQLGVVTNNPSKSIPAVIPIHGPVVTADNVLNFLKEHYGEDKCRIYHFDIAPSVSIDYGA